MLKLLPETPSQAAERYVACDLLPDELAIVVSRHLQVGTELRAAGDIAAARQIESRADELALLLALAERCDAPESQA